MHSNRDVLQYFLSEEAKSGKMIGMKNTCRPLIIYMMNIYKK